MRAGKFSLPYSEGLSGSRRRDLFRLDRETIARSRCKGSTGITQTAGKDVDRFYPDTILPYYA
jgi:hypothetical protein